MMIKKIRYGLIVLITLNLVVIYNPFKVYAATENDLREVIGYGRLDENESKKQAKKILASCVKDKTLNELIDGLKNVSMLEYKDEIKNAIKGKKSYEKTINLFKSGKPVSEILNEFGDYDTYYLHIERTSSKNDIVYPELEKIDESDIDKKMKYASALLAVSESEENIGNVGNECTTFHGKSLYISDMTEDSLSIYCNKGDSIYAQFNGTITDKKGNTITVKSGKTVYISYYNIDTDFKVGQKVKQHKKIGKTTGDTMKISMEFMTQPTNPILMYGNRSYYWYKEYIESHPVDGYIIDLSNIKDYVENNDAEDKESSKGIYIDENGIEHEMSIELPDNYDDEVGTGSNNEIFTEDPFEKKMDDYKESDNENEK